MTYISSWTSARLVPGILRVDVLALLFRSALLGLALPVAALTPLARPWAALRAMQH